jgi:predicted esterase
MRLCTYLLGALMTTISLSAVAEGFPPETLTAGVSSTEATCDAHTAVWVTVDGSGDCIRYYAAGLKRGVNNKAIIYLHGDRLWDNKPTSYDDNSADQQQAKINEAQKELGMPLIMIARPGVYGSSGNHANRRRIREMKLVNAAITEIRKRYQIKETGLTGQSGGGTVAAYVMGNQPHLRCVAITSGALSMKTILAFNTQSVYNSGKSELYDPIQHVAEVPADSNREIFIIYSPGDKLSPIENQQEYATALNNAGRATLALRGQATGAFGHTLDHTGRLVTAWCLNNVPKTEIVKRLAQGTIRG